MWDKRKEFNLLLTALLSDVIVLGAAAGRKGRGAQVATRSHARAHFNTREHARAVTRTAHAADAAAGRPVLPAHIHRGAAAAHDDGRRARVGLPTRSLATAAAAAAAVHGARARGARRIESVFSTCGTSRPRGSERPAASQLTTGLCAAAFTRGLGQRAAAGCAALAVPHRSAVASAGAAH